MGDSGAAEEEEKDGSRWRLEAVFPAGDGKEDVKNEDEDHRHGKKLKRGTMLMLQMLLIGERSMTTVTRWKRCTHGRG
jgi:hypothetical protein